MDNIEFEEIYIKYYKDVYIFILSICENDIEFAEEIAQETFFKALKSINNFKGECKLKVWLFQIAKNTYYTQIKKKNRFTEMDEDIYSDFCIDDKLVDKETQSKIHKILHNMKEPYKEVFHLRTFGELPFLEIAELFGKPESWARVTYYRAKIKIKEELENE